LIKQVAKELTLRVVAKGPEACKGKDRERGGIRSKCNFKNCAKYQN